MNPDALLNLIRSRRSIRRFTGQPVSDALLERLLTAALWGPSAHNRQPWRFVVLQEAASRIALVDAMSARLEADLRADGLPEAAILKDVNRSRERLTGAALLILVCLTMADMDRYPDERRSHSEKIMAVQSVAMASQNFLLLAHAEGLGACWTCAPLFCQETVRQSLDLPDELEPQGMIALGYPAEERTRTREPLQSRVIWR
jgi:F420 biosynthesis protein FbiB-like protein